MDVDPTAHEDGTAVVGHPCPGTADAPVRSRVLASVVVHG